MMTCADGMKQKWTETAAYFSNMMGLQYVCGLVRVRVLSKRGTGFSPFMFCLFGCVLTGVRARAR